MQFLYSALKSFELFYRLFPKILRNRLGYVSLVFFIEMRFFIIIFHTKGINFGPFLARSAITFSADLITFVLLEVVGISAEFRLD